MQATSKELYNNVASLIQKDNALVKSIGDAVFYKLYLFFKYPTSLICKLKGVGFWYMRKKNLHDYIKRYNSFFSNNERVFTDPSDAKEYENNKNQFLLLLDRQQQYETYLQKKADIKVIRYKTQPLQKPKQEEEC